MKEANKGTIKDGKEIRMSSSGTGTALKEEIATYESHLKEWAEYEGKYVLIQGEQIYGFYTSFEDAIQVGYDKFSLDPFLVKQVQLAEPVYFISRLVSPCLTSPSQ